MSRRPTRSTRSKVVYTEHYEEQRSNWTPEGGKNKRRRRNTKSIGLKQKSSSDSSSLTTLEDSRQSPSVPVESESPKKFPADGTNSILPRGRPQASRISHALSYHTSHLQGQYCGVSAGLLDWFDLVKEDRQMPWRKEVTDIAAWTEQQKGQRAYEVWVSEIMLQQTQVETVKPYYTRWISRFPTIFDLSQANVEQVNEYWQGLGYYSRASRLLSGAKKVVEKFNGILPEDPIIMEKEVDGIGPYSAGAIASIAYKKPVPMVDGNIHRVLSRLAALHAPQAAKATTKFLWSLAANLVPQHRPGDFNQALMELGATVCKPREALCSTCPLTQWCRAYQEQQLKLHGRRAQSEDVEDIENTCSLCQPAVSSGAWSSSSSQHVLIYPMAKERKKPGIREVAVAVVLWKESGTEMHDCTLQQFWSSKQQMKSLLIKRHEKGLLAGLWEFPSIDLPEGNDSTASGRLSQLECLLQKTLLESKSSMIHPESVVESPSAMTQNSVVIQPSTDELEDVCHIFSHLKVTYKSIAFLINSPRPPDLRNPATINSSAKAGQAVWVPCSQIMDSNIGNPHKKVWRGLLNFATI